MNRIKAYLESFGKVSRTVIISLAVVFVSAGIAQAATTITTNIVTAGTLSSGNATTTALYASGNFTVNGNATTTASTGAFATQGTFSSGNATTTELYASGNFTVNGNATTTSAGAISTQSTLNVTGATTLAITTSASTTATTFKVGQVGTQMSQVVTGYCATAAAALTASTTTMLTCTPAVGTSLLAATDRVLVMATSSLPGRVFLSSASSTADGTIQVNAFNTGIDAGTVSSAAYTFSFWAFR